MKEEMNGWKDGRMDGWTDSRWTDGLADGRTETDGRTEGRNMIDMKIRLLRDTLFQENRI